MRAAVTTEDHSFEVVDLPDPTPGPDELVIRVAACGICGSDIKAQPFAPAGMVMGHEFGGEIVAVGAQAGAWQAGTNIAVLPVLSCGSCRYCRDGAVPLCAESTFIGMGPAGGFAEYASVPARHSFAVPDELPSHYAALVEPFAVGLHGVKSAEIAEGHDVLIVGAGGVGLTTLVWALQKGAARVTVADPSAERREAAAAMGAVDVVASADNAEAGGYDVVIECVGRPDLLQACQPALRPRGRIVISGACADPTPIEPITALLKELTVRYALAYTIDEFREVVDAFANGDIDPSPTIGQSFELGQIADAFAAVRSTAVPGRVSVTP
ncbi:Zn-dependent alcohol dehydrogenase [Mycolicibacterium rhodesiae NBB3]|jgi:(R,R)-butanediol dehydrogenase/meso-butanediol dehydrogenase/diacetyl reductase|uniref:Zn-dependent alcohol dehydrogenase n=1 Tax=Mycolicibacterium rhodesiae (strain NBB3) TaxID=710685 RepID=G8RPP8_MYCRN|nr:alcohol dehydrogenase catalytic domain-containing protein [Mycolicibacterium rhodesiae]AEV72611.1 Zn-dependent alcohol dehydrogenase [Mycolicibacterium rhodesiae NBB3]